MRIANTQLHCQRSQQTFGAILKFAVLVLSIGAAMGLIFYCAAAHADAESIQDSLIRESENCNFTGLCGNRASGPSRGVDPCYLAQNAMRPCGSVKRQPPEPVGVDANLVGTWKLPQKGGPWVLEILRDATYRFHSEAGDGVAPNSGGFSARNGHWSLKATNGYADGGTYQFQAPDTWIANGKLGTAAWRHDLTSIIDAVHPETVQASSATTVKSPPFSDVGALIVPGAQMAKDAPRAWPVWMALTLLAIGAIPWIWKSLQRHH